jgi:hypothetical protein
MPFNAAERAQLLALKGVGPTVVLRLEQLGYHSLSELALAEAAHITQEAAQLLGGSCWKNSPQARKAIQAAIDAARLCLISK